MLNMILCIDRLCLLARHLKCDLKFYAVRETPVMPEQRQLEWDEQQP